MKKLLIILFLIPIFGFSQTYPGDVFNARKYINSPIYKLSGVSVDSANTVKRGFFTPYQYSRLNTAFNKVTSQWVTSSSNIYYLTGKVGIGWNSPSYQLHVKGDIDADSMFIGGARVYPGDPNRWTDFNHNIYTDWGFVGINTNIPKHWLEVAGGVKADSIFGKGLSFYDSTYTFYLKHNEYYAFKITGPDHEDDYLTINTGTAGKNIIIDETSIGVKVGIKCIPTYTLDVNGSLNVTGVSQFHTTSSNGFSVYDETNDGNAFLINTNTKEILFDDQQVGYKVGIGITTVPTQALDVVGVIKASSYMMQQGIYAGIYVSDASTAQSIPNGTTYTKSTAFTTDGLSANCTSDAANDKITITKTGKYLVNGTCSFSSGTNNVLWRSAAFLGGVEQSNIHWKRKVSIAGDVGSAAFMGLINITSVPVDLDVRFRHDQAGSTNITVEYSNITVLYVGE